MSLCDRPVRDLTTIRPFVEEFTKLNLPLCYLIHATQWRMDDRQMNGSRGKICSVLFQ